MGFSGGVAVCAYIEPCCFRDRLGYCKALRDCSFPDNKCHFRKLIISGENEYDKERKRAAKLS